MDLATATDQVYAATPEDFMAVRTRLVAEARQAKDRELAKAIGGLRKPTRSAWMINLLARAAPDDVGGLLDLGAALREAQAQLSGPELRKLSGQRQKAVAALVRRAETLAAEHGHPATDSQLQEVGQHLQAALADPTLAEDVRAGRVGQIVTFGGFGPWEAGAGGEAATAAPASAPSSQATEAEPEAASGVPAGPSKAEIKQARDAWKQTRATVREAEAELDEAREAAETAAGEVRRLRTELAEAEKAAEAAGVRREQAEDRLSESRSAAEDAERRLEELLD